MHANDIIKEKKLTFESKDSFNKFFGDWNNKFQKNRLDIETFLNDFDNTIITKYWDLENNPFLRKSPTNSHQNIPRPNIDNYLNGVKNQITSTKAVLQSNDSKRLNYVLSDLFNSLKIDLEREEKTNFNNDCETWNKNKKEIEKSNLKIQTENNLRHSLFLKKESDYNEKHKEYLENKQKLNIKDKKTIFDKLIALYKRTRYILIYNFINYKKIIIGENPPESIVEIIVPPAPDFDIYKSRAEKNITKLLNWYYSGSFSNKKMAILELLFYKERIYKEEAEIKFKNELNKWNANEAAAEIKLNNELNEWNTELNEWNTRKEKLLKLQKLKQNYSLNNQKMVVEYLEVLLKKIQFPVDFKFKIEIEFLPENKSLVVNYLLPNIEDMYLIKEFKYNATQNKAIEKPLSKKEVDELYDYLIYSICLQSIRYIFKSEVGDIINSIVFNGWIERIDKATGNDYRACILSVHTTNTIINNINFTKVNPIECFKYLKGISGAKLTNLSPVSPILDISKKDKRFVASQEVLKVIDKGTNLAAMGWEDFEHLIREIFEKEFSQNGGEVKITQASRDGGVDAIAFDPDPIRGGKIVIQAKRYTNVVGVSAVRDLFGTLMNEGATKGILVTTSNYGSDAYEFAKGKPITLLTGANLLSLLGKHGVKARIDLVEAKTIMKLQDSE